jgi:cysteine synthase A
MTINTNVLELIGGTPLVRVTRLAAGCGATILAKLESANPMGSVKDRIAWAMVKDAEDRGLLEPSS